MVKVADLVAGNERTLCNIFARHFNEILAYAARWRRGERWPPIDATSQGDGWKINDGFHRIAAAMILDLQEIDVSVADS